MLYALELFFDPVSERRVMEYWRQSGSDYLLGIGARPHVTIGCFEDIPLARACGAVAAAAPGAFALRFDSVGIFTQPKPWVWLAPVVTRELLVLHAELHATLAFCDSGNYLYYRPGRWVPHCAVAPAETISALLPAVNALAQCFEPFDAQAAELVWVKITRPVQRVWSIKV